MAKRKADKVYWVVVEKKWFTSVPIALYATEDEALEAADYLWESNGGKDKWSVHRVVLQTGPVGVA